MVLDKIAQGFYDQHAPLLDLKPQDIESFKVLCNIYSTLQKWEALLDEDPKLVRPWLDMHGKYITLAKEFGLLPSSRSRQKLIDKEVEEFKLED